MRALLIINPQATSTSGHTAEPVIRELGASLALDTLQTRYRGHARELAAGAGDYDLVVTLGGDGTVNEVVNGLMSNRARLTGAPAPALAPVPGGGANVFARTLGLPPDPVPAARRIAAAAEANRCRVIGLGLASTPTADRYFMFCAGLGVDAEVVADVERRRANGQRESVPLFAWTALRRYYTGTDRRRPALTLEADGIPPAEEFFMGVVTNSAPWTYLGDHPVRPTPHNDFTSGLDVFALRRLRTLSTLRALGQMMRPPTRPVSGRDVVSATMLTGLAFRASRPIACHIDGEYLGESEKVAFRHLPNAMRVIT
ncbi:MAG: diacylglycerol kinase family lipid kinase [Nocardiopsaceae bacterium]|nr:diacylglycerol kinase family lipid kinase [Nocardiopsaceae bacterium]